MSRQSSAGSNIGAPPDITLASPQSPGFKSGTGRAAGDATKDDSRTASKPPSLSASHANLDLLHNQSTLTIGAALNQNEQLTQSKSRQESRAASSVFSLDENDMEMTPLSFLLDEVSRKLKSFPILKI